MKVWIETADHDPNLLSGKSLFCCRLAQELRVCGINVTSDASQQTDVALNVAHIQNANARTKLLRIDGVWHDTGKDYAKKNRPIIDAISKCDAVVYQSYFAKGMAKAYLGDHDKPCGVIYNGTVASLYDGPPSVVRPRPYAVAVAKWRPHKRLRDAVESFLLAGLDADLLVFGDCVESGLSVTDCAQYAETGRVVFCGRVDQATLAGYLKAAVCSIHLCWFDACPNSVVEALCAGVPVVTNNVGGTHELVRLACPEDADWLVCGVDATYTCNPVDLYRPPRIDRGVVAAAIARCFYKLALVDRAALSIKRSADAYLNLMVRLCNQT